MPQTIADVVKVEMRYNQGEQSGAIENVYYVRAGGINDALLDLLYEAFFSWETAVACLLRSDQVALSEIVLTAMNSLEGPRQVHTLAPPIVGQRAFPVLPPNVTFAVHSTIGTRGRGKSGRKFWVGLCDDQVARATVSSATATGIVSAMNELRDRIAAIADVECLCVPHLVVGGIHPPVAGSDCIVRFAATDADVDTQKLRLPNHKKHTKPRTRP